MSCPDDNQLNAWLEGLLGPGDRARVEAHVAACESCRAITGQPEVGAPTEQAHAVGARPLSRVGRFELVRKIGEGGMGMTFVARDEELAREVCLKVLKPLEDGDTAAERQRLLSEARAQAQLSHPAIIPVYEVVSADDVVALVMEYVRDGTSLRAWLRGSHPTAERVEVLLQAAEGLAAAHGAGIVHRDFKPENVMLDRGRARLIDFGLARHVVDLGPGAVTPTGAPLTVTVAAGTPGYMAPEQFAGEPGGPRADQYAFCVTLYEALTGARPFRRKKLGDQLKAQLAVELPAHAQVPARLHAVLSRGLCPDPDARFPDMTALIAAVRAAMTLPVDSRPTPRRVAFVGAAVALVALGGWGLTAALRPTAAVVEPGLLCSRAVVSLLLTLALAAAPLEEAKGLLAEARFEEVATVLAPLLSAPTAAPSERAEAEVLLGLAAHNLLDEKAASRAFTRAVALDAKVRLPPGASPRATALFNDAKAALPTAEAKVAASLVAPPPPAPAPLRPTRVAALVGGGLALALGVSGGVFTGVGLEGRAAAVAEPVGLLAAQRFDEASTAYLWGTGLLFAAAGTLLASTLLFLFPVAQ